MARIVEAPPVTLKRREPLNQDLFDFFAFHAVKIMDATGMTKTVFAEFADNPWVFPAETIRAVIQTVGLDFELTVIDPRTRRRYRLS